MQAGSPESPFAIPLSLGWREPGLGRRLKQSVSLGIMGKSLKEANPEILCAPGYETSKLAPIRRGVVISKQKATSFQSSII